MTPVEQAHEVCDLLRQQEELSAAIGAVGEMGGSVTINDTSYEFLAPVEASISRDVLMSALMQREMVVSLRLEQIQGRIEESDKQPVSP